MILCRPDPVAFLVRPVATDPGDFDRSGDGHAFTPFITPQHSGSAAGEGQAGTAIKLDVDFGEDRHLALKAIPALLIGETIRRSTRSIKTR
jgi:hypothetical protein